MKLSQSRALILDDVKAQLRCSFGVRPVINASFSFCQLPAFACNSFCRLSGRHFSAFIHGFKFKCRGLNADDPRQENSVDVMVAAVARTFSFYKFGGNPPNASCMNSSFGASRTIALTPCLLPKSLNAMQVR